MGILKWTRSKTGPTHSLFKLITRFRKDWSHNSRFHALYSHFPITEPVGCVTLASSTLGTLKGYHSHLWAEIKLKGLQVLFVRRPVVQRARRLLWWGEPHLVNFLDSVRGAGGGRGLLVLGSSWWTGELGMGSRRVGWGWTLSVPEASPLALRLAELLNRLDDLSFFRFCYMGWQEKHLEALRHFHMSLISPRLNNKVWPGGTDARERISDKLKEPSLCLRRI